MNLESDIDVQDPSLPLPSSRFDGGREATDWTCPCTFHGKISELVCPCLFLRAKRESDWPMITLLTLVPKVGLEFMAVVTYLCLLHVINTIDFNYFCFCSFYRHQRFEKAFLLAVDIGARDLFMVSYA